MMPRQIFFLEEFPRGPAGKILLNDLKERIRLLSCRPEEAAESADIEMKTLHIAARVFKMDVGDLNVDAAASDIKQWDSLTHVDFLFSIEKEFGIRLSPREVFGLQRLGDAVSIVRSKLDKRGE
jgi:acyl carrier protein